jgi:hypothetical protein
MGEVAGNGGLDPFLVSEGESLVGERKLITSDFRSPREHRDRETARNVFKLGVWAQTAVPKQPRKRGAPLPASERLLDDYADAVEFNVDLLRQYRDVTVALGLRAIHIAKGECDPQTSWAGYREGYRHPDFIQILDRLAAETNGVLVDWRTVREATRKPKTPGNNPAAAKLDVKTFVDACIEHGVDNVSAAIEAYEAKTKREREAQQRARRVAKAVKRALQDAEDATNDAAKKVTDTGRLHYGDVLTRLDGAAVLIAGISIDAKQIPERFQPLIARHLQNIQRYCYRTFRVFAGEDPDGPPPLKELTP